MYAQTNIQLFNQLEHAGYSSAEVSSMRDAYHLAMELFAGLYRPSGKTFIAHAVGTASILVSLRVPLKLVAAGLLHAAYMHGEFAVRSASKRKQIRRAVGSEVEDYIARYLSLRWSSKTIPAIYAEFEKFDAIGRNVLLIRLANELEDLSDVGILYCLNAESKRNHYTRFGPKMVEMADKLGFPDLAAELTRALGETAWADIVPELRNRKSNVTLIAPRSYRRKPTTALRQEMDQARRRLASLLHRFLALLSTAASRMNPNDKQKHNAHV